MGNLLRRLEKLENIIQPPKDDYAFHMHDHEGTCLTYADKCPGFDDEAFTLDIQRPGQEADDD